MKISLFVTSILLIISFTNCNLPTNNTSKKGKLNSLKEDSLNSTKTFRIKEIEDFITNADKIKNNITERDTISINPYIFLKSEITDIKSDKYLGLALMIIDQKAELKWYKIYQGDFSPHSFSFIDFDKDGDKDLYIYSGFEDVFNSSLFINKLNSDNKHPFEMIYTNEYTYCSLIDINKDNKPEIINTISKLEDEDIFQYIQNNEGFKNKIDQEYDKIVGGFDKYNFNYNMPKVYKHFSINLFNEVNILSVENNQLIDITADCKNHLKFRINTLQSIDDIPNSLNPWIEKLINNTNKYLQE